MKNKLFTLDNGNLIPIIPANKNNIKDDKNLMAKPTQLTVGMKLQIEKTTYDNNLDTAQITAPLPSFNFCVSHIDQPTVFFETPAIVWQPEAWPITKADVSGMLKKLFPEFDLQFNAKKLPAKKFASITITNVKKRSKL